VVFEFTIFAAASSKKNTLITFTLPDVNDRAKQPGSLPSALRQAKWQRRVGSMRNNWSIDI